MMTKKKTHSLWRVIVLLALITAHLSLITSCGNSRREEIEARKKALIEHQQTELQRAQEELAIIDSMLQAVGNEHDQLHQWVMEHATKLNDDAPEVIRLNRLRSHRDSLQVQWQTLGAKIRYIKQKQSEMAK